MDPAPNTPFAEVGPDWWLSVRCRCKIVEYHASHRRFAPDMTAIQLVARLRCPKCGERPREAAWESAHVGPGGLALEARRIRVVG